MNKIEISTKIKEITDAGVAYGIDLFVCVKDEENSFHIEKLVSMNTLKDKIKTIAQNIINEQYLQEDIEYHDISDVIDDNKEVYVLEQDETYSPFAILNENLDTLRSFDDKDIGSVLGFLFRLNLNSKKLFVYQQAYVGSKLQAKNNLRM